MKPPWSLEGCLLELPTTRPQKPPETSNRSSAGDRFSDTIVSAFRCKKISPAIFFLGRLRMPETKHEKSCGRKSDTGRGGSEAQNASPLAFRVSEPSRPVSVFRPQLFPHLVSGVRRRPKKEIAGEIFLKRKTEKIESEI